MLGAPKETILEISWGSLCQTCYRLKFFLAFSLSFQCSSTVTTRSFIVAKQREYENGPPTREPSGETIVRGRDRGKRKEAELYAPDPSYPVRRTSRPESSGFPSYGHDLDSDKADQISGQPTQYQFGAVFALLRGSFPSGNNKHRDCSPPLGETRQFKIQTALIFMFEELRYAGQDPETLDRRAAR